MLVDIAKVVVDILVPNILFWVLCGITILISVKKLGKNAQKQGRNSLSFLYKIGVLFPLASLMFSMSIFPQALIKASFPKSMKNLSEKGTDFTRLPSAAAVIVFTGGKTHIQNLGWLPSAMTMERAVVGTSLSQKIDLPLIIVGGENNRNDPAAATLAKEKLKLSEAVSLTGAANTMNSARAVRDYLTREKHIASLIIVTDATHIFRASLHLKMVGMNPIAFLPVGFNNSITFRSWLPSTTTFQMWKEIGYESAALIRTQL